MGLTKKELVRDVAAGAGVSQKVVSEVLTALTDTMVESLAQGKDVQLIGIGGFKVRKRSARMGVNPQTGATISVPAKRVVGFKAGKRLRDAML